MSNWMTAIGKHRLWFLLGAGPCMVLGITAFAADDVHHQTDFLTIPECQGKGLGTTFYPNASSSERDKCRKAIKSRKYTHSYVSVTGKLKDYYSNPSGFRELLQEFVNDGIQPVVWLTSDTGAWKDKSPSAIKTDLKNFIPKIDDLVSSYCLGIEIEEYWSKTEASDIGNFLQSLTRKKIASHQIPGKWDYCKSSWCDYMILQYGFGKSESEIKSMTKQAINDLGKPVVAGEYNLDGSESLSVKLGNAAVSAGSAGFGNGATVLSGEPPSLREPGTPTGLDVIVR